MGIFEPHERHGGGARQNDLTHAADSRRRAPYRRAFVFHGRDHAMAAAAASERAGRGVLLLSAPGAAGTIGPQVFRATIEAARKACPAARVFGVLDCGNGAGRALAACRVGVDGICIDLAPPARDRVADIARQSGIAVFGPELYEASEDFRICDLLDADDPATICERLTAGEP